MVRIYIKKKKYIYIYIYFLSVGVPHNPTDPRVGSRSVTQKRRTIHASSFSSSSSIEMDTPVPRTKAAVRCRSSRLPKSFRATV